MPYVRCPSCGLLAHAVAATAVNCPRCRALQRPVELRPLGRSFHEVDGSLTHQRKPALAANRTVALCSYPPR
jgi:hypothetical protein